MVQAATPVEWLIEGMLAKGALTVVAGPAKKGAKSIITMQLAVCTAYGQPFLGRPVPKGKVIYANLEDGAGRVGRRLKLHGVTAENPEGGEMLGLYYQEDVRTMLEVMPRDSACDLFVIDPLAHIAAAYGVESENDSVQMTPFMATLREFAQRQRCAVVLVHHYRKAGDMMRGSTAIEAGSDGWWDVAPDIEDPNKKLIKWTLRDGPPGEQGALVEFGEGTSLKAIDADEVKPKIEKEKRKRESDEELQERLAGWWKDNPGCYSQSNLRAVMSVGQEKIRRVLTAMEVVGLVVRGEDKQGWRFVGHNSFEGDNSHEG